MNDLQTQEPGFLFYTKMTKNYEGSYSAWAGQWKQKEDGKISGVLMLSIETYKIII